ncbi:MAG TPA: CapA family protein [Solirubrobacteraceae bacterium]|jgi:poly-gamma-glutamate synthesis protein (capsule biosynthesis protein)
MKADGRFTLAVTGDSTVNMRISACQDPGFLSLIGLVRGADAAFTHVEATMHEFAGPELYPAAEGGWVWMRSPSFAADELRWAGFDIVSLASNHSLDYSYGGLFATWKALAAAGLVHAGTGRNLAQARAPVYLDTPKARVALISISATFPSWARAGEQRHDFPGRPGLNPLRWHYAGDRDCLDAVRRVAVQLGWWVTEDDRNLIIHPPGIHNSYQRLILSDDSQLTMVADEDDVEGNLTSIREARRSADVVIVQLHNHEWDPVSGSLAVPPPFVPTFARAAIDAGASVFVAQGSHAPLRGLELYRGRPILYDPGDFVKMGRTIPLQPADFYLRPDYSPEARTAATFGEGLAAKAAADRPFNPPAAYSKEPGVVVALCHFSSTLELQELELVPASFLTAPRSALGAPALATGQAAEAVLRHLQELSAPFGTEIGIEDGRGRLLAADLAAT